MRATRLRHIPSGVSRFIAVHFPAGYRGDVNTSAGLRCSKCKTFFTWADLNHFIHSMPDGNLIWNFQCPIDGRILRAEPFSFPPDFKRDEELEETG